MVPNTSDDVPEPETPVNTVSRRLGSSTLMSLRLFSRAPWTRIRSWLSAVCLLEEAAMRAMMSPTPRRGRARQRPRRPPPPGDPRQPPLPPPPREPPPDGGEPRQPPPPGGAPRQTPPP